MPATYPETIQQFLARPQSCSNVTLQELRLLFGNAQDAKVNRIRENGATTTKNGKHESTTDGSSITARRGRGDTRIATHEDQRAQRSTNQQRILATEVVNAVLQAFSEKPAAEAQCDEKERGTQESSSTPGKPIHNKQLYCAIDWVALAKCGVLAFDLLVRCAQQSPGARTNLQVEKGMLAFVGKLIFCQMRNEAVLILCLLRRSIYAMTSMNDSRGSRQTPSASALGRSSSMEDTVKHLMIFPSMSGHPDTLVEIILHYQCHVLRLTSGTSVQMDFKELLSYVDPGAEISPYSSWLRTVRGRAETKTKLDKLITEFAHALQALAFKLITYKDNKAHVQGVELLATALRYRLYVQKRTGQDKPSSTAWVTLIKLLSMLTKGPGTPNIDMISTLRNVIDDISNTHAEVGYIQPCPPAAWMYMSQLWLRAGEIFKAQDCSQRWLDAAEGLSSATRCAANVRIVRCVGSQQSGETAKCLLNLSKELSGQIAGSNDDILLLLHELSYLPHGLSKTISNSDSVKSLHEASLDALCACCRLYIRLTSQNLSLDAAATKVRDARRDLIVEAALPLIETILTISGRLVTTTKLSWSKLLRASEDCVKLSGRLLSDRQGQCRINSKETIIDQHACLRASEMCWSYFEVSKEDLTELDRLPALQYACNVLANVDAQTKDRGSLCLKLHRLGRFERKIGDNEAALATLGRCLSVSQELGCLDDVKASFRNISSHDIDGISASKIFFSALKTWIDMNFDTSRNRSKRRLYFDNESLESITRATLLEWQMRHLDKRGHWSIDHEYARLAIASTCAKLYEKSEASARQLRLFNIYLSEKTSLGADEDHQNLICQAEQLADTQGDSKRMDNTTFDRCSVYLKARLNIRLGLCYPEQAANRFDRGLAILEKERVPPDDFHRASHDIRDLLTDFQQLVDYFKMRSDDCRLMQVLLLGKRLSTIDSLIHLDWLLQISQLLLDLGYTKAAKSNIDRVKQELQNQVARPKAEQTLRFVEGYYWYLKGDSVKSNQMLQAFMDQGYRDQSTSRLSGQALIGSYILQADFSFVKALWSLERESACQAILLLKTSVHNLQRLWKTVERSLKPIVSSTKGIDDVEQLTESLAEVNIDSPKGPSRSQDQTALGICFWPIIPRLVCALRLLASLFKHVGLGRDAENAMQQAMRIAESSSNDTGIALTLSEVADTACRNGREAKARQDFEKASQLFSNSGKDHYLLSHTLLMGSFHKVCNHFDLAHDTYEIARTILREIAEPSGVGYLLSESSRSVEGRDKVDVEDEARRRPRKQAQQRKTAKTDHSNPQDCRLHVDQANYDFELSASRFDIERGVAECLLSQDLIKEVRTALEGLLPQTVTKEREASIRAMWLLTNLREAMMSLNFDAVLSMVPESAIAFQAIEAVPRLVEVKHSSSESEQACAVGKSARGAAVKRSTKQKAFRRRDDKSRTESSRAIMLNAFEQTVELLAKAGDFFSSKTVDRIWSTLLKASMILSLPRFNETGMSLSRSSLCHFIELPRNLATIREQLMIQELPLCEGKAGSRAVQSAGLERLRRGKFDEDFLDVLPLSWTVLSISLVEDGNYLHLCRYRCQQEPLILRLPLYRQRDDDATAEEEDEMLTFGDAMDTFKAIMTASEVTVHQARNGGTNIHDKAVKAEWWSTREQLDSELRDLLVNIENAWFGGFRGILSPHQPHLDLLGRFQENFSRTLAKHLPSRQRHHKEDTSLRLGPSIHDLFISLGEPARNDDAIVESLTDLLYFVVDTLQYANEPNAYDEIDFDALIVEIVDALRSYHEDAQSKGRQHQDEHLILVLDKQLHALPWESMPCLQSVSVSRVHSMIDVRDRVACIRRKQQQHRSDARVKDGIRTSRNNGAYFLNPGSDLPKTEKRFSKPLSSLTDAEWTPVVARLPSESEFEKALKGTLSSNQQHTSEFPPTVLYFGHGSGLQYIRHKKIRALRAKEAPSTAESVRRSNSAETASQCSGELSEAEMLLERAALGETDRANCATTLLFGCSSASLTDCGEFEPHGVPKTYLIGGAPAVLGALWDVTDGDCDAFAQGVLTRWGLLNQAKFESQDRNTADGLSRKCGKGRKRQAKTKMNAMNGHDAQNQSIHNGCSNHSDKAEVYDKSGCMSLSEAAARSKRDCYLQYLNGAAMVVYGVPVYLADTK